MRSFQEIEENLKIIGSCHDPVVAEVLVVIELLLDIRRLLSGSLVVHDDDAVTLRATVVGPPWSEPGALTGLLFWKFYGAFVRCWRASTAAAQLALPTPWSTATKCLPVSAYKGGMWSCAAMTTPLTMWFSSRN